MGAKTKKEGKNKSSVVRARVDSDTKKRVEVILDRLGLNTSEAIRLYLKQIELHQGLPFSVNIPNKETRRAMKDAQKSENVKEFNSEEALFEDLDTQ